MSRDHWPKPKPSLVPDESTPGDSWQRLADADRERQRAKYSERVLDTSGALRAQWRTPRVRQIVDHGTTLHAVSAHDLLEQESEISQVRPGHPY